jgi:hypothetical protein
MHVAAPDPEAKQRYEKLLEVISRAKIELIPDKKGRPKAVRVLPGASDEPVDTKATQLVSERFGDMPAACGILSGVTHGMPYMLSTNARFASG